MGILLTDEEQRKIISKAHCSGNSVSLEDWLRAQAKKAFEELEKLCPHVSTSYPSPSRYKSECGLCRQALKKEAGL